MIQLLTILQLPDEENRNFCNYSLGLVIQNCHKSIDMGIADKLKRTLNGQEEEEDDVGILTTVCHPSKRDSCFLPSCYSCDCRSCQLLPSLLHASSCYSCHCCCCCSSLSELTNLSHGLLGIISMPILPPAQKITKIKKQTQQKTHPTGYATEILIPCISLTIDEHSGFHSLFRCAKFEFSTVGRTKVINVQSTPCSKSGFVFFVVLVFLCGFLTWWWWQNRHAYNPRQPMLYLIKSTMYLLSSFLRFTSIFVIKSTEVKDQLFDLVANYQLLASLKNQQYFLQCPSSFSFEWLLFLW